MRSAFCAPRSSRLSSNAPINAMHRFLDQRTLQIELAGGDGHQGILTPKCLQSLFGAEEPIQRTRRPGIQQEYLRSVEVGERSQRLALDIVNLFLEQRL